jgi:hypothetical protein
MPAPVGRLARVAVALLVLLAVALGPGAAAAGRQDASVELASQTPTVEAGGVFALGIVAEGASPGASLRVTVHDRVRSRSELGTSSEGEGLRRALHTASAPLDALPTGADGARQVVVSLAASASAGQAVNEPGVYPVSVDLLDGDDRSVASLVTHLVLRPPASQATPPLGVAVLASIGAAPQPDGEVPLADADLARALGLVDALAAAPDVAATLAITPDTLAGLVLAGTPEATALVEGLRAIAATRPALALPYVDTSPDALVDADLDDELEEQLDRGGATLADVLGIAPTEAAWLAGPDLGAEGLDLLRSIGVRRAVVAPSQIERASDGVLSLARPFELAPPRGERNRDEEDEDDAVQALVTDTRLGAALAGDEEPALLASHVLADLAALWFEQPGTARAVVVPIGTDVDPAAVRAVLDGLRTSALFRPVALDDAFSEAAPLLDRAGDPVRRALDPEDVSRISGAVAEDIEALRDLQPSVEEMVGPDAASLAALDAHLLRAEAAGLTGEERRVELDGARGAVDDVVDAVNTPETVTITLTAREGTVPLTIRNETGAPVDVRVRLRSPKLELPEGDTFSLTLARPTNRLDIPVRTRASGSFPFDVEVTSPDGRLALATTRYSVRSTAVSGVGLVLSIGAGAFLILWWARHWREHRRATKLVPPGSEGG